MSAMLQDVEIDYIQREQPSYTATVSNKELENEEVITDTVRNNPLLFSFSGEITENAEQKKQQILKYRDKKTIVNYNFRNEVKQGIITSFSPVYTGDNPKGFTFTMTIQEVVLRAARRVVVSQLVRSRNSTPANNSRSKRPFRSTAALGDILRMAK